MKKFFLRPLNKKGIVLVLSFVIIAVLSSLGAIFMSTTISESRLAQRNLESTQSFWLAEAGVQRGMYALINGDWSGWAEPVSGTKTRTESLGTGTFTVTITDYSGNNPLIASRGNVSGIQRQVQAQIAKQVQSPLTCAAFGKSSVTISGVSKVDSYNSSLGAYGGGNVGANGDVGTNGVTAGAITLTGNSIVNGDVATGPGGTVSLGSGTSITGTITHDMAKDVPSVVVPTDLTGLVNQGNYSASGHSTGLLTAGDYKYSQLSISGNATVTISGKVRLYITANPSLSISGNGMLIVAPGAELEIYTAGSCSISGNGIANQTNVPKNLLLFSTYTGNNGMSFSGNADLYGVLYAPDTNVACSGNASLYGSMVGNTVSLTGNAELHYDEALTDVSTGFFPCTYIIQSWREQ